MIKFKTARLTSYTLLCRAALNFRNYPINWRSGAARNYFSSSRLPSSLYSIHIPFFCSRFVLRIPYHRQKYCSSLSSSSSSSVSRAQRKAGERAGAGGVSARSARARAGAGRESRRAAGRAHTALAGRLRCARTSDTITAINIGARCVWGFSPLSSVLRAIVKSLFLTFEEWFSPSSFL